MKLTSLEKRWILYDVGNSAFILILSTIIPIYFKNIALDQGVKLSQTTALWGYTLAISTLIIAFIGPLLGAVADHKGMKKKLFIIFMLIGSIATLFLAVLNQWVIFALVIIIARIGFNGSIIFYDSMLGDISDDTRVDKVSTYGYAWGYIGSCIPFILCLVFIMNAEALNISASLATSISFIIIGLWWALFSLPLIKKYKQIHYVEHSTNVLSSSLENLKITFKEIYHNKVILTFLIAFFLYIDGVYTIIEMATSYGKDVGISDDSLLLALLLTQFVAFPFAILIGRLTSKIDGTKIISISIVAYFLIALFALQLDQAWEFWFLAVCVAIFQGGIQALSRSYFTKLVPKERSNEFFGIFDIFGKGATFAGVLLMGVITQITGHSRYGVLMLAFLFVFGFILFRYHLYIVKKNK